MPNTCRCRNIIFMSTSLHLSFFVTLGGENAKSPHHLAFCSLESFGFLIFFFLLLSLVGRKIFHMCAKNAKEWTS